MAQRTVDVHNHWYPPDYLAYLVSRTEAPYARQTGPHSYVCYAPGDVIVAHIDRAGHLRPQGADRGPRRGRPGHARS